MATHRYSQEQKHMLPVPPDSDWDSKTSFLVLKDGKKYFEGDAAKLARSENQYIREYLTV